MLGMLCMGLLASCEKDKNENLDTEVQTARDYFFAERQIAYELREVQDAMITVGLGKSGPVISFDTLASPQTMVIDYDTATLCSDGKIRSGKLNVTFTGKYKEPGTLITIAAENFVQSGNRIEGSKILENKGRNAAGKFMYSVIVENVRVTKLDGKSVSWSSNRSYEWIEGENTPAWNDDVYLITGSSNGTSANELAYTSQISSPLRLNLACEFGFTSGIVNLIPKGKRPRVVNYGDGTCDNMASVTIGNNTTEID